MGRIITVALLGTGCPDTGNADGLFMDGGEPGFQVTGNKNIHPTIERVGANPHPKEVNVLRFSRKLIPFFNPV